MTRGREVGDPNATQLQAALPPISRTELARLRRGELDANAVAALVERTTGLGAPSAPAVGDILAPELRSLRETPTRPVLGAGEDTPLLVRRPVGG